MALVSWPSTLPLPTASGFSFSHKRMGSTLEFASGRCRITRNRMLPFDPDATPGSFGVNLMLVNTDLSFVFTYEEYAIFSQFYDTNWKRFTPQQDGLQFEIGGLPWNGWPTSKVKLVRNDNTWTVSFGFECFIDYEPFTFSAEEKDHIEPAWPVDEFSWLEGCTFSRSTRDIISTSEDMLLSRITIPDDNFIVGEIKVRNATIQRILRIIVWWQGFTKCGALPFKILSTPLNIGPLNGQPLGPSDYMKGKILTPPQVSFDGYYGTASFSVVLCPYVADIHTTVLLIRDSGAWFVTNTGNHLRGVY